MQLRTIIDQQCILIGLSVLVIDRNHIHVVLVNHKKKSYAVLTIDVSTHMTAVLYPLGGCSVWTLYL